MFDRSQFTRLLTLALATCAVTWMLAASAIARPDASASARAPGESTAPAYQPQIGDALKTPDPVQVQRVLAGIGNKGALPHARANSSHDVDPLVIVGTILGLVMVLGAVTLIVTYRQQRPVLRF